MIKVNFFKKGKSYKRENFVIDPNIYWMVILGIFFILMLLTFFFGYTLFKQSNQEMTATSGNPSGQATKDMKEKIDKTLQYFKERENKSVEIINSPSDVVDPSF